MTTITGKKRDIVQLGNPLLRRQAEAITDFDTLSLQQIIADMHISLAASNGVGIAAPQIGESVRIVIVASRPNARYPKAPQMSPVVMINPSYEITDPEQIKDWEGCLSVPGIRAQVPRYRAVQVKYQNEAGEFTRLSMSDFVARVFQHEYDHLQGMVYLDRVADNRDIIAEGEYLKLF